MIRMPLVILILTMLGESITVTTRADDMTPAVATPPRAKMISHQETYHGQTMTDNYYWLRNREQEDVLDYLKAENIYTQNVMKPTQALQDKLFEEMKSRIKETDLSVPVKYGPYQYYSRTEKGKQYRIHARKGLAPEAAEEIILDENELAGNAQYFRLGTQSISPNHQLIACGVDTNGSETYTLRIKNLVTGAWLSDSIPNTYYGLAWGNDNETIFYTTLDDAKRPDKVYRHTLGTPHEADQLVYHETDERFHTSIRISRSQRFIFIDANSQITSEVSFIDANRPNDNPQIITTRRDGVEYSAVHHSEHFYIVTNDKAINFKIVRAPIDRPSVENWDDVIPYDPAVRILRASAFRDHLVIQERHRGLRGLRTYDFKSNRAHEVSFPEPVYTVHEGDNPEFEAASYRYEYTSLVTPRSIFDYDFNTQTSTLRKRDEVLGGYDHMQYESKRIFAYAKDGTRVPVSLVYKKGLKKNGTNPTLLYGYGSYGISIDPGFNSNRISLLDRGFVYAIAHIRGGGDLGRPWYQDGKFLKKKNTFTDFIAAAEHLIHEQFTSPDHLAILGGSAGGLLMGAVTNMRPDLFKVVIANVPFVDVVNTMLDASIPLTVIEYEEWGNPNKKEFFDYMLSYSPYDNVTAKAYPNILITAGLNDPRVQYWEPAKWTAKLRTLKTNDNRLLLKTNMGAGHSGKSGRYEKLHTVAFDYAFMLDTLGIKQ